MDFGAVSSKRYFLAVSAFLVLLFTMLELESIAGTGFFVSLLFWSIQIGLLIPLLITVQTTMQQIRIFNHLNVWIKIAVSGLIASFLFIPLALGIDYALGLDDWTDIKTLQDALPLIIEEIGGVVGPVTLTWIGINAPRILRLNFQTPTTDTNIKKKESDLPAEIVPYIYSILPKNIGRDIVYIASEMHYLRVVTTKGKALELYSLNNAIKELAGVCEGVQTHRAYWVSKSHIDQIVGKAPNRNILTKQGYLVPISRRQYSAVRAFVDS